MAKRGRKPIEGIPRSKALTTRVQPKTRQALEEAARASRHTISRVAERILEAGLGKPSGEPRNRGLAWAIAALAEDIERETRLSWRQDQFTAQALRHAIETLLLQSAKQGQVTVPPAIEREAATMPPDLAERFRTPAGFGQMRAYGFVRQLKQAPVAQSQYQWNYWLADLNAWFGLIARDLGLVASKKGKSK